jgi:hypothetical protein
VALMGESKGLVKCNMRELERIFEREGAFWRSDQISS